MMNASFGYDGMNIEKYVMVDFNSFTVIADKLGGLTLDITAEEMEQINHNAWNQYKLALRAGIDEKALEHTNVLLETYGPDTHLNGRQVVAYARIRKIDSDFSRAERQRKVLIAFADQLRGRNAADITSLLFSLVNNIKTNLSPEDMISISLKVLSSDLNTIGQLRLPVNGTFTQDTRKNQSMLFDTDWEANKTELHGFIYR
jgi:anionic cell wall polymer biosynthesis LytR-Cps2A-Psr (LCP) family protein